MTVAHTSKAIRAVLEDFGIEIYSVRKRMRYYGGQKFNLAERGQARQSHHKGRAEWFFVVDLLSNPGVTDDNYELAAVVLRDAGYKTAEFQRWSGLTVHLPDALQKEHRAKLKH